MVLWLGLGAFTAGARVQSLLVELRSCKPRGAAKKKKKKKITLTCVTTIKLTTEFSTEIMEIHTQWNTFSLMKVTTNVDFCGQ